MNTSFEIGKDTTTTWLTPINIIRSLGEFDLDPCTPEYMPWLTANHRYTEKENGLTSKWFGRVWLNPPYGKGMVHWLEKMAKHGNGIALTFNRSETEIFHKWVFPYADAILIKKGRVQFLNNDGKKVGNGPGCGSLIIAYGKVNVKALENCGIEGKIVYLKGDTT